MLAPFVNGLPGVREAVESAHRIVFRQANWRNFLAGGRIIDGDQSGDPGNTGDVRVLRPGVMMGRITATGKYAPSFVGITQAAYTSGGTELTVTAAQAVEINRLVGGSGTAELTAIGPPSAAGTVALTSITHSAIDTTTGIITVTSLGVNKIAGTLIAVLDGRQLPLCFIPDGWGHYVLGPDGSTEIDTQFPDLPITGVVDSSQLLPGWPSDTSLQAWIVASMNTYSKYVFDHGL
jgi:hypothetical protein